MKMSKKLERYGAAYDLAATHKALVRPHEIHAIGTGVQLELEEDQVGLVCTRSGLAKQGLMVVNAPGIVDPEYRGEVKVIVTYLGRDSYVIKPGDRIAQLLVVNFELADFQVDANIALDTPRGDAGFGSTGV